MVHIKSSIILILSVSSFAFATPAQINAQVGYLSGNSSIFESFVNAFPMTGGTMRQALAIDVSAIEYAKSLQTAAKVTAANGPLDAPDAINTLASVKSCLNLENALNTMVAKKSAFTIPSVSSPEAKVMMPLMLSDLRLLNESSIAFADAFIKIAPATVRLNATALRTVVLDAFAVVITEYK